MATVEISDTAQLVAAVVYRSAFNAHTLETGTPALPATHLEEHHPLKASDRRDGEPCLMSVKCRLPAILRCGAEVALVAGGQAVSAWPRHAPSPLRRNHRTTIALWTQCDVADGAVVNEMCIEIQRRHGRLDCAFNNSSSGAYRP